MVADWGAGAGASTVPLLLEVGLLLLLLEVVAVRLLLRLHGHVLLLVLVLVLMLLMRKRIVTRRQLLVVLSAKELILWVSVGKLAGQTFGKSDGSLGCALGKMKGREGDIFLILQYGIP